VQHEALVVAWKLYQQCSSSESVYKALFSGGAWMNDESSRCMNEVLVGQCSINYGWCS
jgi:hypothetical protein